MTIQFQATKKGTMTACLFPETHDERDAMIKSLKDMGFSRNGKFHNDTRMTAVIDGIKHTAIIENIDLD